MITNGLNNIKEKVEIDLSGQNGNVFVLMSTAKSWAKKAGKDGDAIVNEMMSGDYDNAVEVFDREFGDICVIYKPLTGEELEIVSEAEERAYKTEEEKKLRTVYEAVCLNNTAAEDCFEEGVLYRVVKEGLPQGMCEVEDMNGDVVEVLRERFGELIETEIADDGNSFEERVDVLKKKLYLGVSNDEFNDLLDGIKEVYHGENLKADIRGRMGGKAYRKFEEKFVEVMLEVL